MSEPDLAHGARGDAAHVTRTPAEGPVSALAAIDARLAGQTGGRGAVRIVLSEGRKREVRRMLAAVGLPVRRLIRVRVGPIALGQLPAGKVRDLEPDEIRALQRAAGR